MRKLLLPTLFLLTVSTSMAMEFNPFKFFIEKEEGYLIAEGRWDSPNGEGSIQIPVSNSVSLNCHRLQKLCTESRASLIQPKDDPSGNTKGEHLFTNVQDFEVLRWNDDGIEALASPGGAEVRLSISFSNEQVLRSSTETDERGVVNPKSHTEKWVLK